MKSVTIGQPVPAFDAKDNLGNAISTKELLGQTYVLYFYPKDDTPGCTKQACSLRDVKPKFDAIDVKIIGISPDDAASHDKFIQKYNLNFSLIPDSEHQICEKFGVWQEKKMYGKTFMGVVRSTFVIDNEGFVRWIESPVEVEGQEIRLLEALQSL